MQTEKSAMKSSNRKSIVIKQELQMLQYDENTDSKSQVCQGCYDKNCQEKKNGVMQSVTKDRWIRWICSYL